MKWVSDNLRLLFRSELITKKVIDCNPELNQNFVDVIIHGDRAASIKLLRFGINNSYIK